MFPFSLQVAVGNPQLIAVLIGHAVSILILLGVGALVLARGTRKLIHVTFFFLTASVGVFSLMVLLSNIATSAEVARTIWTFNIGVIFVGLMFAHWVFLTIDEAEKHKVFLTWAYITGILLVLSVLSWPTSFIASVEPKLYFNYYANPGVLYYAYFVHFYAVSLYAFVFLVRAYLKMQGVAKKRIEFVIFGSLAGHVLGSISFPLIWNVEVDPFPSAFLGIFPAIFAYAVYKYQLMDIREFIKRALIFAISVALLSWLILLLGFVNDWVKLNFGLNPWVLPVVASLLAVFVGRLFWLESIEAERLKYEFVTIAAHKLRTPLTRVKYAASELIETAKAGEMDVKRKGLLDRIVFENDRLIRLTGLLLDVSGNPHSNVQYRFESVDLKAVLDEIIVDYKHAQIARKKLNLRCIFGEDLPNVWAEEGQIASVMEMLMANAVTYTPEGGTITVTLRRNDDMLVFSISDTGIGISKEDMPLIFNKFFRTEGAKRVDTEGVGISLSLAQSVVERHGGDLRAHSAGENQGTTFTFTIPIAKDKKQSTEDKSKTNTQ